ncbi:hypothetical protein P4604_00515 [Lysinibacillus capsici]|uniref:hypothetical protein n=1 Tax=Lysinibacillus capsici TaxID=2115968 RepID=UPI002E1A5B50|nr:hypothetical protein [Lysinibacillus capsici]
MSYNIKVLNNSNLTLIGTINNVINAEIYEIINDQYTADIQIAENTFPSFLHYPNLVEIDGDFFIIAGVDKQRDNGKAIKLMLEHVSYELNNPSGAPFVEEDEEEFYEGSPESIISQCWGIGAFQIVDQAGGYYYYRPSASGGRSRINEFARQNGLEIEYNKFVITIHNRRGAYKGLVLEVGKNIRSITEKIELNDSFGIEYAHEVDIVDFSKMTGSQQQAIASAELGDTVTMIDTDLAIYASERIVGKRYNPLFKEVPQLDVGQVIRDIVNIINNDEKEKKEEDPTVNYFLQSWQIGKVNCMALSGIELDQEDILPEAISASIDYYLEGEHKGMSLTVKPQYNSYHIYIGEWYEDNSYIEHKLSDVSSVISTWNFPKTKLRAISITVCEVPLEEYNPDIHKLRDYAVNFNKVYIDPLREFKVGKKNVIDMNTLIEPKGESLELDDFSAKLDYHLMQEYEGVRLSLRREFESYKVLIITMDADGVPTIYDYATVKDQLSTWRLPREDAEYLLVSISDVTSQISVNYGIKFEKVPFEPLYEFRIGQLNCLQLNGVAVSPSPALNTIQAEVFYKELDEYEGLRLTLLREYRSYYIGIRTYDSKGKATDREYTSITDWTFPRKSVMHIVISIMEKPPSVFNPSKHRQAWYAIKFTEQNSEVIDQLGPQLFLESETVKASSGGARFDFTETYTKVISVALGVGKTEQTELVTGEWSLVENEEGVTGVLVDVKGLLSGEVSISIQAVCQMGLDDEESEVDG